jgi:hypothetical protein
LAPDSSQVRTLASGIPSKVKFDCVYIITVAWSGIRYAV